MEQVREMDNYALQRLVGELLGWHIEHEEHKFQDYVIYRESFIVRPDGSKFNPQVTDEYLEQELVSVLPEWSECLDDAIELVAGLDWFLGPDRYTGEIACSIEWGANLDYGREHCVEEFAPAPARAVTLAWVAWKLAQKE